MRARLNVGCLAALVSIGILGASCSDADKDFDADEDPGSVRGIIRSGTADYFDEGRTEKVYAIQQKDGSYVKLEGFNGAPGVRPGSEVRIYGPRTKDSIRADFIKVLQRDQEGLGATQQPSRANPPALSPPLKNAFVSLSPAYTEAKGKPRLTKADFIKPVMEVSSYGRWTTEWEFYGPYTVANDCGGSFFENVGKNGTAAMKAAGVDPAQFNQIQFYINISSCGWGGFGLDGHTAIRTDGLRGQYNPWSYVKNSDNENVMVQEIGHNWGLAHVHFCPGAATPSPTCSNYTEYGSPFTPMASGNNVYLNAWERIQMNFFSGCNVLTVGTSGSYEIGPLNSACEGPQVLRIAADKASSVQRYWYLEYRQPYGIETAKGVLLHYSADIKNGGWSNCDYGGPDCPEDWVMNPMGSKADNTALLQAGATWTTPEGVGVTIASLGATAKFDLTFPKAGAAPFCDLANTPWDNKAPSCTAGPQIDGGTPPIDGGGTGGTGGTDGMDAGKDGAAGSAGSAGAGGASDAGRDVGTVDATGGKGGTGGMGGASGSGGAAGSGGRGGAAGVGGTAGLGGAAGTAGTKGGSSGSAGSSGASGASGGQGGSGVGTGGSPTTGGSGGSGGTTDDGCGCRVPGRNVPTGRGSLLALMASVASVARRLRRRRPS